jgi:hypothetical protein
MYVDLVIREISGTPQPEFHAAVTPAARMPTVDSDAPLIRLCRQEALSLAGERIGYCLSAARASLEHAAHNSRSVTARQAMLDALDQFEQRRAALRLSFPQALDRAIAEAVDTPSGQQPGRERKSGALPNDTELALLDDSELARFVETARLMQIVQPVVERTLTRLDSLMSSALGQPMVRPDLNPMRPEVLCRALTRVLDRQSASVEVRRLWLRHMAKSYAKELNDLYGTVADLLERMGVQKAQYYVKLTEGEARPVMLLTDAALATPGLTGYPPGRGGSLLTDIPGTGTAGPEVPPASPQALEEDLSDDEAIRRRRAPAPTMSELTAAGAPALRATPPEFLYSPPWAQPSDAPLPPDYYAAIQRQLAPAAAPEPPYDEVAWRDEQCRLRAMAVVDRPARAVTPQTPLPPQQWGEQAASPLLRERTALELKAQAIWISQALGMDAARALVAQIAGDERLLAPIRQAVVALEPALLRLALAEPRFLDDGEHPALRFIEQIAQRSFQYNDEFALEFEIFFKPARQMVRALDAIAQPSGQDFDQNLKALQSGWQAQDQAEQQAREQGWRAMAFAQERQQLAGKITQGLSQRSDLVDAPEAVVDFLLNDWSLVIAHAQLTDVHRELDPGGYLSIITDLLWSVKWRKVLRDLARLFEIAPRVVATLRKGLEMLGQDPHELQASLDMLLRFHEPALNLRRMRSTLDPGATLRLPKEKNLVKPGELPKPRMPEQPWLSQRERDATGFIGDGAGDAGPASLAESVIPARPQQEAADAQAMARAQLARLRPGCWVDLRLHQEWRRAQLTWISDRGLLYLFASHGGRAHSTTCDTLEKRLQSGHVRPLNDGPVVGRALEAIATNAGREPAAKE